MKHYAFDSDGRLISERNSVGGGVNLKRKEVDSDVVTGGSIVQGSINTLERLATGSSNYVTTYRRILQSDGANVMEITQPTGLMTRTVTRTNQQVETTSPDGSLSISNPPSGDPRFGMVAPVPDSQTIRLPHGPTPMN